MSFPSSLDDLSTTRGTTGAPLSNPNHITHHTAEDSAIQALETKVGIDSSAVTTSLDYKLKSTSSINPGHKHTNASVTLGLDDLTDVVITTPANGNGLTYNGTNWVNSSSAVADASTTVKGLTELNVAPASPTVPIAIGANNTKSGTAASGSNKVEDEGDTSATSSASKLVRFDGSGKLDIASLLSIASMAQGDLFYASSGSALTRLGAGTSGQFLKTQGAAANPVWANIAAAKFGTISRTTAAGTGTVSVTGVGFQPNVVIVIGNEAANSQTASIGFSNGSTNIAVYSVFNSLDTGNVFNTQSSGGDTAYWTGTIDTLASDGFNVNYLKTGSGMGDFTGYYIAFR